ncbi:hypothetical protein QIS99_30400 [Streptomyces sp. B-S-A8]|uniref:Uncharacterized protein n=1 Tax=Streptomyces solicavernae TaxID=3043614 RepID=A0ABT6S1D5_9ACTN|nr:hypothetical protein [Streptomyces sp. B-S-A8]MDI3390472.1 hypothetical protein [Streptomyces sp. B-S-A8]
MTTTTVSEKNTTPAEDTAELTGLQRRLAQINNPGLYLGSGLGAASGLLSGEPLLLTTASASAAALGWAALGMNPGPWRFLPGQGEPWEWMCRSSRRGYRRTVRRMRRRLAVDQDFDPVVGTDGLLVPTAAIGHGWYEHERRPDLVRGARAGTRRARCTLLRAAWDKLLPDWENGWWRRYGPTEMALRAGPLAAIPAAGFAEMPWWGHLAVASLASSWGAWVWDRPDPAVPGGEQLRGIDWYLARWDEWIAAERGELPYSRLLNASIDDDTLSAIVYSTTAKSAAVAQDAVSIAFEVPPRNVNVYRPDDMPANRARLTVKLRTLTAAELDMDNLPAVWQEFGPWAGSELYDVEETDNGRTFKLLMPRRGSSVADVQPRAIAQALDLPGEDAVSRLHLRMLDARRIEVNEMTRNPLQGGVALDLDALVMDEHGYVIVGRDVFGEPTNWRLLKFDHTRRGVSGAPSASAVHSFGSGITGAGKTSLEEDLQLAQRINGFVSWLADGKGGAGYAPWFGDLDWLVKSSFGAMLMAQTSNRVSEYRYSEQMKMQWLDAEGFTENGRSFFVPGEPFAPVAITYDEFNEMVLKNPNAPHVKPLLRGVSSTGRLSRAAGMSARIWVQIPNLDSIGSDSNANAIRDMLQSGNIALFRTARKDVDIMSLGSRKPEFPLAPIPERFPDGSDSAGTFYVADGSAQYIQARAMFHTNPARLSRSYDRHQLTQAEADAAAAAGPEGVAYLAREDYRHMDAVDEEEFLRELVKKEQKARAKNGTVIDTATGPTAPAAAAPADLAASEVDQDEDDELDNLVPPSRSQLVWHAVEDGARRNGQIAKKTDLKPSNVANATKSLARRGKLAQIDRDWHTLAPLDEPEPAHA